tara:strand:+ start:273 stop:497 length:225 start_codon:yes stop_codon:yes gene_type:complete
MKLILELSLLIRRSNNPSERNKNNEIIIFLVLIVTFILSFLIPKNKTMRKTRIIEVRLSEKYKPNADEKIPRYS